MAPTRRAHRGGGREGSEGSRRPGPPHTAEPRGHTCVNTWFCTPTGVPRAPPRAVRRRGSGTSAGCPRSPARSSPLLGRAGRTPSPPRSRPRLPRPLSRLSWIRRRTSTSKSCAPSSRTSGPRTTPSIAPGSWEPSHSSSRQSVSTWARRSCSSTRWTRWRSRGRVRRRAPRLSRLSPRRSSVSPPPPCWAGTAWPGRVPTCARSSKTPSSPRWRRRLFGAWRCGCLTTCTTWTCSGTCHGRRGR